MIFISSHFISEVPMRLTILKLSKTQDSSTKVQLYKYFDALCQYLLAIIPVIHRYFL